MSGTTDCGASTPYGFTWGPLEVSRCASLERPNGLTRVVQVKAGSTTLDVYVSPGGRNVRVFSDGCEWKPETAA